MEYNVTYRDKDKGIQVIVSYKDHYGKWKQKSKQGFKKKGDAKKAADKIIEELKELNKVQLSDEYKGITFREFKELYLKDVELHFEYKTFACYQSIFNKVSKLDNMIVEDIRFIHIQDCVNDMVREGMKSSSIVAYTAKLKTIFKNAVKTYKIIPTSPIDNDVRIPESKEDDKMKALTKYELDDLLSKIKSKPMYITSLIASTCGLRIAEIIGLTWNDIDFANSTLNVNKQWKRLKNGTIGFGPLKTKNSNRIVPIPTNTLNELISYKENSITDLNNRIIIERQVNTMATKLKKEYVKLGYDITVHDLRHTYATLLISGDHSSPGLDFKTVAKLLGNTVEMVMRTYSHVNQDMIKTATNKINSVF